MPVEDYRVKLSWRTHPKRAKLRRRLGRDAVLAVMDLWGFVAESRPEGKLCGMSNEDIALAAQYDGDHDAFVEALVDIGLVDGEPGEYEIHDLDDHNPWVSGSTERSENARRAARKRWRRTKKNRGTRKNAKTTVPKAEEKRDSNAGSIDPHCGSHESALLPASIRNAPTPYPIPTPTPNPKPSLTKCVHEVFDHYRTHHPRAHPKPNGKQKEWRLILARFKEGYSVEDLCKAIDGCHRSPFHQGENDRCQRYDKLELIVRDSSHVQQFMDVVDNPAVQAPAEVKAMIRGAQTRIFAGIKPDSEE